MWLYLFVEKWQFGVIGVAISRNISFVMNIIVLLISVKKAGVTEKTECEFKIEYLKDITGYLKVIIPTAAPDYLK